MRNWRVLTAIAAVVLAALAGVLVWKYTDNAKNDAKKPFEFVSVLIAGKRIPVNTSFASALDAKLLTRVERVRTDLPPTRIETKAKGKDLDNATLKASFKTLVAGHDIAPGQTVVNEDFVAQGQVISGLTGQLESDQALKENKGKQLEAMTLTFDDQRAVGGFLAPGDLVNVMVTMSIDKDHFLGGEGGTSGVKFTSFLMPHLKILAVGSTTAAPAATAAAGSTPTSQPVQASARSLITFEVTPRQATQLVQAQAAGTMYLSLNPPSSKPGTFTDPEEVVEAINLFDKQLPQVDQANAKRASQAKQ